MKKFIYSIFCVSAAVLNVACSDDDNVIATYDVTVSLDYPEGTSAQEGVIVTLTNSSSTAYVAETDAQGVALFNVPAGIYAATASDKQSNNGASYVLNGSLANINVGSNEGNQIKLELIAAKTNQLIIKELYTGGCPKDDGSGNYQNDCYVTIYNNSDLPAEVSNLALAYALPFNSHANNTNYVDGKLNYENEGFQPAGYGIWYFQENLTLAPYSEVVVAITGAIDHTKTYSQSVNLANSSYYCCYDPEDWNQAASYPAPYEGIPTNHYLLAEKWGMGTAWPISKICPAFFLFATEGITPSAFAAAQDYWYDGGKESNISACLKVKNEWVIDAVEVFTTTSTTNTKRFTSAVDAGAVFFTNKKGFTVHRVVDVEATKAIEGNETLLVTGLTAADDQADGVVTVDPSGIDAKASVANGAKIIYKDTNNSTNDFFERYQSSLRD